jgi:hypothetical protein
MGQTPREQVPDFLLERLESLDDSTLAAVAEFARNPGGVPEETVPQAVVNAVVMQDEQRRAATAAVADDLARGAAGSETGSGDDPDDDSTDDDSTDDDVPSMGPFFG